MQHKRIFLLVLLILSLTTMNMMAQDDVLPDDCLDENAALMDAESTSARIDAQNALIECVYTAAYEEGFADGVASVEATDDNDGETTDAVTFVRECEQLCIILSPEGEVSVNQRVIALFGNIEYVGGLFDEFSTNSAAYTLLFEQDEMTVLTNSSFSASFNLNTEPYPISTGLSVWLGDTAPTDATIQFNALGGLRLEEAPVLIINDANEWLSAKTELGIED